MTGEITLSGLVFPVGGVKEKVLAAHRAGIRRIIMPHQNEAIIEDIPEDVRGELEFVLAHRIDDVLEAALEKDQSVPKGENYIIQDVETHSDGVNERLIAKEK
jgi:ATP-dependent Lon protease